MGIAATWLPWHIIIDAIEFKTEGSFLQQKAGGLQSKARFLRFTGAGTRGSASEQGRRGAIIRYPETCRPKFALRFPARNGRRVALLGRAQRPAAGEGSHAPGHACGRSP